MSDVPTTSELDRRLASLERTQRETAGEIRKEQREGFAAINSRLDGLPRMGEIETQFKRRDDKIDDLRQDIADLTAALAEERAERIAVQEKLSDRADAARRWIITTAVSGAALLLGLISFFVNLAGGAA